MARGDRPALMAERRACDTAPRGRAVEAVWRIESARIVGALTRYTGDFGLAEDVAQEALAEALVSWPRVRHAGGSRRRGSSRRRGGGRSTPSAAAPAATTRYATIAQDLSEGSCLAADRRRLWDPDPIDDDVLALMFVACHPVLSGRRGSR